MDCHISFNDSPIPAYENPCITPFLSLALFSFQATEPLRVFLIGDSTMADKIPADYPETDWGTPFAQLFNEAVEIQNHTYNGRSTKSFCREGR